MIGGNTIGADPMLRLHTFLLAALVILVASGTGQAATVLVATLSSSQENPPTNPTTSSGGPRPAPFGTATFTLNDAQTALSFTATIFNIDFTGLQTADVNDNLVAAHIHAGAAVTPTTNGSVVWGFFGSPFNDTNSATPGNDCTPFSTGVGGTCAGTWDATEGNGAGVNLSNQLPFILDGRSYINFHTTQFGGGEIRGNITNIPEPSTLALLGFGVVGLMRFGRLARHWKN
jgi:hypothetical protein